MAFWKSYTYNTERAINNLYRMITSNIPGISREFLSDDSVEEAELNELNYPVELLNCISGTASFLATD